MFQQQIAPRDEAVKAEAERDPRARLLMTQPGVGPITSLAYVLTMGDVGRFARAANKWPAIWA
jgi:transposase